MIKIFLPIFLAGCIGFFAWYVSIYNAGFISKKEGGAFFAEGYRLHQEYDGFRVLTSEDAFYKDYPLINITVISDGRYTHLEIIPKARGNQKVKYLFLGRNNFVIKKEVYERVKATIPISKEVDEFLAAHVAEQS